MKKRIAAVLAATFVMGATGVVLANPFSDVPTDHWAYDAVNGLAKAGIINGYNDGTYKGDKTFTRYEMAQLIANAMSKTDRANAEQKAVIAKLGAEFADELNSLDARVTALESKEDKINVSGLARLNLEKRDGQAQTEYARLRLNATGEISNGWGWGSRIEVQETGFDGKENSKFNMKTLYVKGQSDNGSITLGRMIQYIGHGGLTMDDYMEGAQIGFGNKLKTNLFYGKTLELAASESDQYYGAQMNYRMGMVDLYAAYQANENKVGEEREIIEGGFAMPLSKSLKLTGAYADSNAETDDKAYSAFLNYKGANLDRVGSYGLYTGFYEVENNADLATAFKVKGEETLRVGLDVVPFKNVVWTNFYDNGETKDFYRSEVNFYF